MSKIFDESNDPDSIVLCVPGDMTGPVTLVKVSYCGDAEVMLPVDVATAAHLVEQWEGMVRNRPDPRTASKDAILSLFRTEKHLTEDGVQTIIAATLYFTTTSDNRAVFEKTLERGGQMILVLITNESGNTFRFRVDIHDLT